MGCLYRQQRSGGNWLMKYYVNGKPVVESSRTTDKRKAKKMLQAKEGDVAKGKRVAHEGGRRAWTFEDASTAIQDDYRLNGRATVDDVERRIRLHLAPVFGGRKMSEITSGDINAFRADRIKAGATPGEVNRELAVLKRMFTLGVEGERLHHRPAIKMLAEKNVRQGFFERAQFEAVRRHLPEWLRGPITFAYLTGWRLQSEVVTLEWRQVDRAACIVRLDPHTTKNDEGRTLPYDLLPELVEVIDAAERARAALQQKGAICAKVFHNEGESLLTESGMLVNKIRVAWDAACKAAGAPGMLRHDFRRTAVRNLVRASVPEKTAMQITGHKTRNVFDRYDIVNEADLRAAVGKLATASTPSTASPTRRRQ